MPFAEIKPPIATTFDSHPTNASDVVLVGSAARDGVGLVALSSNRDRSRSLLSRLDLDGRVVWQLPIEGAPGGAAGPMDLGPRGHVVLLARDRLVSAIPGQPLHSVPRATEDVHGAPRARTVAVDAEGNVHFFAHLCGSASPNASCEALVRVTSDGRETLRARADALGPDATLAATPTGVVALGGCTSSAPECADAGLVLSWVDDRGDVILRRPVLGSRYEPQSPFTHLTVDCSGAIHLTTLATCPSGPTDTCVVAASYTPDGNEVSRHLVTVGHGMFAVLHALSVGPRGDVRLAGELASRDHSADRRVFFVVLDPVRTGGRVTSCVYPPELAGAPTVAAWPPPPLGSPSPPTPPPTPAASRCPPKGAPLQLSKLATANCRGKTRFRPDLVRAIDELQRLLASTRRDARDRPALFRRLADSYAEVECSLALACTSAPDRPALASDIGLDEARKRTEDACRQLRAEHPGYPKQCP